MYTIKRHVEKVVNADLAIKGNDWLLSLSFGDASDYATDTANLISRQYSCYVRASTVERYVRVIKAKIRATQVNG